MTYRCRYVTQECTTTADDIVMNYFQDVAVDSQDRVYTTGKRYFGKWDTEGNLLWYGEHPGSHSTTMEAMCIDEQDNVYHAGYSKAALFGYTKTGSV